MKTKNEITMPSFGANAPIGFTPRLSFIAMHGRTPGESFLAQEPLMRETISKKSRELEPQR